MPHSLPEDAALIQQLLVVQDFMFVTACGEAQPQYIQKTKNVQHFWQPYACWYWLL